jgi:hypothetical protein
MDETFKAFEGYAWNQKNQHWISKINTEGESALGDSRGNEQFHEALYKAIEGGVYADEQLYNCNETTLYSILLPNKSDLKNALSKVRMKTNRESGLVAVFL